MPDITGSPQSSNRPDQGHVPGSHTEFLQKPSEPMARRLKEPDWPGHFWRTLTNGLPAFNLLLNPYFPETAQARGGWRELIEKAFRPPGDKVDGQPGRNGAWAVSPQEALNLHAIKTAKSLLTEPPKHFTDPIEASYFCFLEVSYAQYPEWAIIHRPGSEVFIREDYRLCRPGDDATMMATVVGPVIGLHRGEVRLWEAISEHYSRAFVVIEDEEPPAQ